MTDRDRRSGRRWLVAAAGVMGIALSATMGLPGSVREARTPAASQTGASQPAGAQARIAAGITELVEKDATGAYDDVRAVLVSVGGSRLEERYYGSSAESTTNVFAVTRAVMSILVGIAVDEGHLRGVHQTLGELLPAHAGRMTPRMARITLRQVLTMTAGLPADGPAGTPAHIAALDWVDAIIRGPLERPPGEAFADSGAGSHLLSAILARATGQSVLRFAREQLFDPLGIDTDPAREPVAIARNGPAYGGAGFAWPVDRQGHHVGDTLLKLSPGDLAKIGQLMLDGGQWQGRRILSQRWVAASTRAQVRTLGSAGPKSYGYQWWVTTASGHAAFAAVGLGGQLLAVVPALRLVVVVASTVPDLPRLGSGPFLALVDQVIAPALEG